MMQVGRKKLKEKNLCSLITLKSGDAETVAFPDDSFDAIVVGFGVRNFQDLNKGLSNLLRVLKPAGTLVILEFSYPTNPLIRAGYNFYFSYVSPLVGKIFSKDPSAYSYLTQSVKAFPRNEELLKILEEVGYGNCSYKPLTFGIAAIYSASKTHAHRA
jgi:demethylmenaquinone methyltransferase/2-methoxy-6-polyprenyl-1,4-benzoquinol methylase